MIGGTDDIPEYVRNSGFEVTTAIKMLGFTVTKDYKDLDQNYDVALQKIQKIIRFWERFRLSLPGRINVSKTLLLSQICFHGSITPINDVKIQEVQAVINSFISSKMKLSKESITLDPCRGGAGFINIKLFLQSLQCSWVKRALQCKIDSWRLELAFITGGNICLLSDTIIDPSINPILHSFAKSFVSFKMCFYMRNNNFLGSHVLHNPCVIKNKREKIQADENFWINEVTGITWDTIASLKISDFLMPDESLKDDIQLRAILRSQMDNDTLLTIKTAVRDSLKMVSKGKISLPVPDPDIRIFLLRFRKGSKPIRRVFEMQKNSKITAKSLGKTTTFFRLIACPKPEESVCLDLYKEWCNNCYPIKVREFIFKFRSNLLGINTRVSHFNANVARGCTFCSIHGATTIGIAGAQAPAPLRGGGSRTILPFPRHYWQCR
jgi:hypothetical protein